MSRRFLMTVLAGLVMVACGGDTAANTTPDVSPGESTTPSSTTTATTAAPTTAVATTVAAAEESGDPPLVEFDGTTCSISGTHSLESGLVTVSVHNSSPNPAEAIVSRIDDGFDYDAIAADVGGGEYDRYGLTGWERPEGLSGSPVRMPPNATDPIQQSLAADAGTWVVICLDIVENRAYLAATTIEVA